MCPLPSGTTTLAQYPPRAQDLPYIDYDGYHALKNIYEYGAVEVTESGAIIPRRPLRPEVMKFLGEVGLKNALWNGRNGIRGMVFNEFEAAENANKATPPTANEVARLRGLYMQLLGTAPGNARQISPRESPDVREDRTISASLPPADLRGRKTVLEKLTTGKNKDGSEVDRQKANQGTPHATKSPLSVRDDLSVPSKRLVAIAETAESDESAMKRMAMLERVFGYGSGGADCLNTSSLVFLLNSEDAEQLAGFRQTAFLRYMQTLRVYADAKSGVGHLRVLEGTLKSILENLKEAMQALSSHAFLAEDGMYVVPVSPSYRLRYIKTLRATADELLPEVIRFCPFTGIGYPKATKRFGRRRARLNPQPDIAQHRITCCGYSTYSRTLSLLPEFTKLLLLNSFRMKHKISALYEHAAAAYEEVNAVYDFQMALTKRTFLDLREAGANLTQLENRLRNVREKLLLEC
jgi:hypothetical protein